MATYKTPDVYVKEIPVFPPSVAEVETAIPAFIGYTETARKEKKDDLRNQPMKIYSFKDYERYFGAPNPDEVKLKIIDDAVTGGFIVDEFTEPPMKFILYFSVKMYFDNGGGQCYIISVGDYTGDVDKANFVTGLEKLELEDEPTLIIIPEATRLSIDDYGSNVTSVLMQCKSLGDRFGIFDLHSGDTFLDESSTPKLSEVRGKFPTDPLQLKYGGAYYPFIKTTMNFYVSDAEDNVKVTYNAEPEADMSSLKPDKTGVYNAAKAALRDRYVTLPPSGAIAGVYAATDLNRGVWKAPANVSLANVIEPIVKLDNVKQASYNVDAGTGKSINALRAFAGKGTMVWGARTLAGNDNEWRYVSVRRFFNLVEESVKKSTYWAVFEPNDANTWVRVRGMIENYLIQKWREGALAGSVPDDAFFVRCGLGVTMDSLDILEGRMNVEIGMAVVRPAEFIILKFFHKLQTS